MLVPVSGVKRVGDTGAWVVLALSGEIDRAVTPLVREAVDEVITEGRVHLVWDLQGVSFMDSAGLGVLAYTARSVSARGGRLRLAGAGVQVCRILELTGLDTVVEQYADLSGATGPLPD